jgi:antitoxin component YwqK of YwqJK toxin-antitoxin module
MGKYKLLYIAILAFTLALFFLNKRSLLEAYYVIFNKSGELYSINDSGNFDGKAKVYIEGNKTFEGNFKNGRLDGWVLNYYNDGTVKSKYFYVNGKIDKTEYRYHANGKKSFKGTWRNGIWYGNQYYYNENGNLITFDVRDMDNGFYYSSYGADSKVEKIYGYMISDKLYIKDRLSDSIKILRPGHQYQNIDDLYITVANPPNLKSTFNIYISGSKPIKINGLHATTIKVKQAFKKNGRYDICIYGELRDMENTMIKRDTVCTIISKIE